MVKFFRKISILDGKYGSVSIPLPIFEDFLEMGSTHLEITYDERRKQMTATPI